MGDQADQHNDINQAIQHNDINQANPAQNGTLTFRFYCKHDQF